jgi:RNA polymerase sigma-70 factor (ECF subfamily)
VGIDFSDDEVLVRQLRRGDEAAFVWLVGRYDRALRRLALDFVATPAIADEVVGDTWLAIIEGIDRFEGRSSLKTWIYRILMNKAKTRGIREKRTVPFSSVGGGGSQEGEALTFPPDRFRPPGDPEWPGHWASPPAPWQEQPVERLEAVEALAQVRTAIDALPANQRTVITLRDVRGLTSDEVCDLLDVSPGNQRVLLHRARAAVRRQLELLFDPAVT